MRITEDRKGRLLETLWELNDRFQAEDDDALGHMFSAVTEFAQEAAADERDRIVTWLRSSPGRVNDWDSAISVRAAKLVEERYSQCT